MALKAMLKFAALWAITAGMLILSATLPSNLTPVGQMVPLPLVHLSPQRAIAQSVRILEAWQQVYDLMPELPLENQYVSLASGQISPTNTLASRLIRYHTFIKGRAPNYRFDWKLTLADYLGVNERMVEGTYPGSDTLRTNPLPGDKVVINQLNRSQRDRLVGTLVTIFSTPDGGTVPSPDPAAPPSQPAPTPPAAAPIQPRPGDAQLLLP